MNHELWVSSAVVVGIAVVIGGGLGSIWRYALSAWIAGFKFTFPLGTFAANVLSRGIVGDIQGQLVVASPLYKQHFNLETGVCLQDVDISVEVHQVRLEGDSVLIERYE